MDFGIYAADTNKTIYLRLRDSTTGLAKTGLVFNSAGAVCSYTLPLAARAAIALATQTVTGAHSDGGFVEVDATNCKGLYRLDLTDAAIASGDYTIISIEFDGIIEESIEIPLHTRKVDVTEVGGSTTNVAALATNADAIKTKTDFLPSATAGAAGGLFIAGTNAATTITTSLTTTFTGNVTGSVGSVTGAVGSVTGAVGSVTGAVGSVAGNVDGNVTGSVGSLVGHTVQTGDNFARIGAPIGASISADLADVPTVSEFNARTLVAASYFDPAADTVATVTTLTNLPTIPANWLTAAGITASALDGKGDWNTTTPPTAASVADTVWDEAQADHVAAGSFGIIATEIAAIPTTAMRGTDSAALASVATEARLAELDAANLPTDIAAIPTTAMRGTDSAALASVATEARLAELDAANLPTDIAAIPTTAMRGTDSAALASVATEARLAELDAANLPADIDTINTGIYHADIEFTRDQTNTQDEYNVIWFLDGVPITTGITLPKIQVIKRTDGTDLVAATAMTEIGSTETYKYDEATNRITLGEAVLVVATMTHASVVRTWKKVATRDST